MTKRDRHKMEGLCRSCTRPAAGGGNCLFHKRLACAAESARRLRLKRQHRCKACGVRLRQQKRAICGRCTAVLKIKQKAKWKLRLQSGKCPICATPLTDDRKRCTQCRLRNRIACLDVTPEEKKRALSYLADFNGHCEICNRTIPSSTEWHLDHNHKTKKFRGILCPTCNPMLGYAQDNQATLRKGAEYLRQKESFNV